VDVALRQGLWEFIGRLNRAGHTIVLTTHYLEEAEALCNRIAMLKQGRIVALDTTANLLRVARRTQKRVRMRLSGGVLPPAILARHPVQDGDAISIALETYDDLEQILAELRLAGESVQDLEVVQPDLQDVFMQVMTRH
jgi:ABC-2 type transport system ATP-binding protein